jgi:hypothetical protein
MAARKRPLKARAVVYEEDEAEESPEPKRQAPVCHAYVEPISPIFDPKRVLLRRVFFINARKSKYISVGFYPARNYEPMVEFGSGRNNSIILGDTQVRYLSEAIPRVCESLCNNESVSFKDGKLRLTTTASKIGARLYLGKQYMGLTLEELRYIRDVFYVIRNQQLLYIRAMSDVMSYVNVAQSSTNYIEPHINADKSILYSQLFEELKTVLVH